MKNFEELKEECLFEIDSLGIKPGVISSWMINSRAKTRWGLCKKKSDGSFEIQIAKRLIEDDNISKNACKETIIHEILHTCKDAMNHTGKWRIYAEKMNLAFGYNIKRTTSGIEKGVENYVAASMPPKYIFICKGCGAVIYRKKESKFTRNYRQYGCRRCGAVAWSRKKIN
ncbi:SprT-like domain-containing protein (plasmid) [Lachnospiraceae bacterium C1.1]|nr:hypothetical protein [Lachnospiraceae bacterium C1.1]